MLFIYFSSTKKHITNHFKLKMNGKLNVLYVRNVKYCCPLEEFTENTITSHDIGKSVSGFTWNCSQWRLHLLQNGKVLAYLTTKITFTFIFYLPRNKKVIPLFVLVGTVKHLLLLACAHFSLIFCSGNITGSGNLTKVRRNPNFEICHHHRCCHWESSPTSCYRNYCQFLTVFVFLQFPRNCDRYSMLC